MSMGGKDERFEACKESSPDNIAQERDKSA